MKTRAQIPVAAGEGTTLTDQEQIINFVLRTKCARGKAKTGGVGETAPADWAKTRTIPVCERIVFLLYAIYVAFVNFGFSRNSINKIFGKVTQ